MEKQQKSVVESLRTAVLAKWQEGREARVEIQQTRGRDRYDAWFEKRRLGEAARYVYLAYALVRGRAYRVVEATSPLLTGASESMYEWVATEIASHVRESGGVVEDAEVIAWLRVPEDTGRAARRVAARDAWFARRASARVGHPRSKTVAA